MKFLQHNAFHKTFVWSAVYHRALFSLNLSTITTSALKVAVITGSTRTSGPPVINKFRVANFITKELEQRGNIVTLVDPGEFVMMEKPEFCYSPKDVPKKLENFKNIFLEADAYVCITPEYNHAPSPGLINVLNHFGSSVFSFKPSAIVSYSAGQWGGTRAAVALRPILSELGALPGRFKLLHYLTLLLYIPSPNTSSKFVRQSVPKNAFIAVSAMIHIPNAQDNFDDDGNPINDPKRWQEYCNRCFSQLEWWAEAAKEHKIVTDPFARSKPFRSSPSQRNTPPET